MRISSSRLWKCACAFVIASSSLLVGKSGAVETIQVRVYNYSDVPAASLEQMMQYGRLLLSRAGIDSKWIHCPLDGQNLECGPSSDRTVLFLRIVASSPDSGPAANLRGLGLAYLEEDGGRYATLYHSAASRLAAKQIASLGQILGFAAAHETGHLLLGPRVRNVCGVMSDEIGLRGLLDISQGVAQFSSREAAAMRERLEVRIAKNRR